MGVDCFARATGVHPAHLPERYKVVLCDLWGCVHDGVRAFAPALETLRLWRSEGRTVLLLTNAPRPSSRVSAQLEQLGVGPQHYDAIISSGDAGIAHILSSGVPGPFGFMGSSSDRAALEDIGLKFTGHAEEDIVICTGFHEDRRDDLIYYESMLPTLLARRSRMLCFNPDMLVLRGGVGELCAGAIAERYAKRGGSVTYFGKPNRSIYDYALAAAAKIRNEDVGRPAVLAVGDSVRTDLAGAASADIDFLFVSSGIEAANMAGLGTGPFIDRAVAELGLDGHPVVGCVEALALS